MLEITFKEPYTCAKLDLVAGVNVVAFLGLPQDGSVSVTVSADSWIVDDGDHGSLIDDDRAFNLFSGGVNKISIPGMGRSDGVPTIRIGDPTGGTVARFLLTRAS